MDMARRPCPFGPVLSVILPLAAGTGDIDMRDRTGPRGPLPRELDVAAPSGPLPPGDLVDLQPPSSSGGPRDGIDRVPTAAVEVPDTGP